MSWSNCDKIYSIYPFEFFPIGVRSVDSVESDKLLNRELHGVFPCQSGSISVSYTRDSGCEYHTFFYKICLQILILIRSKKNSHCR